MYVRNRTVTETLLGRVYSGGNETIKTVAD